MHPSHTRVSLSPSPAFCLKSTSLHSGVYTTRASPHTLSDVSLSPSHSPKSIPVPKGLKVFVNIAYDPNVPPPPPGSEAAIQKAMLGLDPNSAVSPDDYFVPVIISEGREDTDKAGKPSLVFDAVFNSSLKLKAKDIEFKAFLIELAFQRIEAQSSLTLSRSFATPNIPSKGKLTPRTVLIPNSLYPGRVGPGNGKTLVQEVNSKGEGNDGDVKKVKGILKNPSVDPGRDAKGILQTEETPEYTVTTDATSASGRMVTIRVPRLRREDVPRSTLDLEAFRLIFDAPGLYSLDTTLDFRAVDLDKARAEWRVGEGVLIVYI